jgi:hypothetical protein
LSRASHQTQPARRARRRHRRAGRAQGRERAQPIPLTESGTPAAQPGAAPPSGIVTTTAQSRARFPWLPAHVIAGSVWRGPGHEKVKVDAKGEAKPWPPPRT